MSPENNELPITPPEGGNEMPSLVPELLRRLGLEKDQHGVPSQAELLANLTHPEWQVRAAAVRALGRLGALAPLESLLMVLDDPHPSVRANAVLALSTLGERTPVERLIQVLHGDPDWQVRESAVLSLTSMGQLAREESRQVAFNDPDSTVRQAARLALAQFHPALQAEPQAAPENHRDSSFLHALPGKPGQNHTLQTHIYQEDTMSGRSSSPASTTSPGARRLPGGEARRGAKHPVRRVVGLSITAAVLILMLLSWALLAHTLRTGNHNTSVGASGASPTATTTQNTKQSFSGKTLFTYTPGTDSLDYGSLMSVGWSPQGKYISVSGIDVVVLNAANGKAVKTLNASSSSSEWASWSSNGTRLVSSSAVAQVWDVETGKVLATFIPQPVQVSTTHGGGPLAVLSGGDMIYASTFSPNGKYVASALDGNGIGYDVQIWDAATGAYIRTLQVRTNANVNDYITQVGWSHDGKYIAAASPNNGVIVWDASTGQRLYTKQGASVMTWAPQSDLLATTVNATGLVEIWQATTGQVQSSFQGQTGGNTVDGLSWSPNGTYIAASGHNVRVWDVTTNKLFGTYTGQGNDPALYINGLAWSPDSTKIASLGTGMHVTAPHTGYPLDAVKVWEVI